MRRWQRKRSKEEEQLNIFAVFVLLVSDFGRHMFLFPHACSLKAGEGVRG